MQEQEGKTQIDLIKLVFQYLNSFKRHRALTEIQRREGKQDSSNYHKMKAYEQIDFLELTLRAIQKGQRELDSENEREE